MHCHCGTNNRAPRWTFTDPCKPEVRPGAREDGPMIIPIPMMVAMTVPIVVLEYVVKIAWNQYVKLSVAPTVHFILACSTNFKDLVQTHFCFARATFDNYSNTNDGSYNGTNCYANGHRNTGVATYYTL